MHPRNPAPRAVVENVWPRVDEGRVPICRVPGDRVEVSADAFADGSAHVRAAIAWRRVGSRTWLRQPMHPVDNDRWRGEFVVPDPGRFEYAVEAWVDPFLTWRDLFERREQAGTTTALDRLEGAAVLEHAGHRIHGAEGGELLLRAGLLRKAAETDPAEAVRIAHDPRIDDLLGRRPDPGRLVRSATVYPLRVDPPAAQHSAWYELFPRSTSVEAGRAGTLRDLRARLPYIAGLGFDVVYLPPIHPIGQTGRRGPNNRLPAPPDAPGSPWAIGSAAGGHTEVAPELGDLAEFEETVRTARALGLEVALDLAFQCSPDHPWVREHPTWFPHRPDGTIRTAENPPKRYDDIYPLDFDSPDWAALWDALLGVVETWVARGVRWFRVDNPHTKPFEFWRWLISEVRAHHPDVLFLAEAFTRPKVMYRLAEVGFTHSYTYFAWRTRRDELTAYFRELSDGVAAETFRPHLWPNTPDILTEQFHAGQRSVFLHRLVLAATLSSHYGIYGPAYELLEHVPLEPGSEEYLHSEKYEVRHWDLDSPVSLAAEVRRVNEIRRAHPALRTARHLVFHETDNDRLLAYSRRTDDGADVVLVVVNLDPVDVQSGWTALDLPALGLGPEAAYVVHDLVSGHRYSWRGSRNFVRLDPGTYPAHLFAVEPAPRSDPPPAAGRPAAPPVPPGAP